jgi:hypothetical protein
MAASKDRWPVLKTTAFAPKNSLVGSWGKPFGHNDGYSIVFYTAVGGDKRASTGCAVSVGYSNNQNGVFKISELETSRILPKQRRKKWQLKKTG